MVAMESGRCRNAHKVCLASEDEDFHFRIIRAAKCEPLERLLMEAVGYQLRIHRARARLEPQQAIAAILEHKDIANALQARNPAKAEQKLRRHIRKSRLNLMSRLPPE